MHRVTHCSSILQKNKKIKGKEKERESWKHSKSIDLVGKVTARHLRKCHASVKMIETSASRQNIENGKKTTPLFSHQNIPLFSHQNNEKRRYT